MNSSNQVILLAQPGAASLWTGIPCIFAIEVIQDWSSCLLGDELSVARSLADDRQKAFSTGRQCARRALYDAGWPETSVPRLAHGAPAWPAGAVGSLSHCDDLALAAVTTCEHAAAIGVDIENHQPVDSAMTTLVATTREQRWLNTISTRQERDRMLMMLFSAKESVFKCLNAEQPLWLEFHDVELVPSAKGNNDQRFDDQYGIPIHRVNQGRFAHNGHLPMNASAGLQDADDVDFFNFRVQYIKPFPTGMPSGLQLSVQGLKTTQHLVTIALLHTS